MCQFKNQLANLRSAASVVAYDDNDDRVNTARISHKSHALYIQSTRVRSDVSI